MERITVKVKNQYNVLVGSGLLDQSGKFIHESDSRIQKLFIVSDSNVAPLYLEKLRDVLQSAGFEVFIFVFAAGEQNKNLETVGQILGQLAQNAFTRTDAVVALGGGVTTDIAGFSASIFLNSS